MYNIDQFIETSNQWLKENRPTAKPIIPADVEKRLSKGGFLSVSVDAKTTKGVKSGYLTGILYLAPHKITGANVCPMAKTCIKDCLFNAGRGRFASVSRARIIKTLCYLADKHLMEQRLIDDITRLKKKAHKLGLTPVVRLNGTSDINVEYTFSRLMREHGDVQFYDYTKNHRRFFFKTPVNYDLTFSFDGTNWSQASNILNNEGRVAVVFAGGLPDFFDGWPVINGDNTDLRFLDGGGVVVGLTAKGSAKKDGANDLFVIDTLNDNRCTMGVQYDPAI